MVRNDLILCSVIALITVNTASAASLGDFFNNLKKDVENAVQKTNRENQDNSRENEETNTVAQSADSSDLTRQDNREIQQLLANAGYDPGPIDGLPGNKTKVAIKSYQ
ncbi:MAG: peptidoglycan-binding domain-containing protein, partial [Sedimenticola sp.]